MTEQLCDRSGIELFQSRMSGTGDAVQIYSMLALSSAGTAGALQMSLNVTLSGAGNQDLDRGSKRSMSPEPSRWDTMRA